jgi:hypothetical protein
MSNVTDSVHGDIHAVDPSERLIQGQHSAILTNANGEPMVELHTTGHVTVHDEDGGTWSTDFTEACDHWVETGGDVRVFDLAEQYIDSIR